MTSSALLRPDVLGNDSSKQSNAFANPESPGNSNRKTSLAVEFVDEDLYCRHLCEFLVRGEGREPCIVMEVVLTVSSCHPGQCLENLLIMGAVRPGSLSTPTRDQLEFPYESSSDSLTLGSRSVLKCRRPQEPIAARTCSAIFTLFPSDAVLFTPPNARDIPPSPRATILT